VQPVALAYDPLAGPRHRAYVSFAPAIAPTPGRLTEAVDAALRAATPLTPGQLAATALRRDESLYAAADEAIATARDECRPIEPALLAPSPERRAGLRRAFERARRRGAGDPLVRRLALELESAGASPGSGLRR
jgi:hypothetical protein